MCVGIPLRITAIDGIAACATDGDRTETLDLSLVPEARPGDWVLGFLGTARAILAEAEAQKIRAALAGLSSLMQGGGLGEAFADLDRPPQLPPHLQSALDAGQTQG
ncbi:HypC/HybG/HupF family hydrogenase formation chaperone [Rhodobacter sp. Har01]|uniref:HypC/HybG/HupF family hydrogenase formation chaperone n=1 Tax=Rhodobacter sp. Har01 TaxID=2883999 RepID=UPI001D097A0F|nr:HypC/HybG/HupF family hydrogenase formation chaperone [Rhodobacter sp. Har01]MCB6176693.1 HypC/HybG/HupF family hydrogenase formation chaperone [Rhodobacter sp. Har01]